MFEMTPFEKTYRSLFRNPFADLEKDFFRNNPVSRLADFQTDVRDLGDAYLLEADLPGIEKKDIRIELSDHRLTIRADRIKDVEEQDAESCYLRQERFFGSFTRSFDVSQIDESGITAVYENGVLKLTLPKLKEVLPAQKIIEIQ